MRFGGAGVAGAGLAAYGIYEAAQMEKEVQQILYHAALEPNEANKTKIKKMLQDGMISSGYGLHEIAEAAKQEVRLLHGVPGNGIDVLPEMLRAASTEALLKGSTPAELMKSIVGLAHMTKSYDQDAIKKLAPAFAFLSTINPSSLGSMERAAGYAVPVLQSGLELIPWMRCCSALR